ncbi:MAG TPA: hypothetical protein VEA60_06850 [Allosphingosinicella sp.]|nr:hypothetical protein [Allosphingosinicella sp.]
MLALAGAAWSAEALACVDLPESIRIADSDAVVDGVATCVLERGRCRLRASEVVKEDRRRPGAGTYVLRFEPGERERWRRHIEEGGEFNICQHIWEPGLRRFEGRFYLSRVYGGYHVRSGSPDGMAEAGPDPDEPMSEDSQ